MKYMGWSWADYCDAPTQLITDIITQMIREAEELDRLSAK